MAAVSLRLEAIGDDARTLNELTRAHLNAAQVGHVAGLLAVPVRRPWVARITGRDPKYGLARDFLPFRRDWTEANRVGSRGVYQCYELSEGEVYEVRELTSWASERRYFCRVEGGQVVELTRAEVDAWLDR